MVVNVSPAGPLGCEKDACVSKKFLFTAIRICSGGSKGERQARAPLGGPNSFIFMQFSATKIG